MFARLLRAWKPETNRPRNAARLACELLEDRTVPAIIDFSINTIDDTPAVPDPITGDLTPKDANGNYSLRSVIEYGNANPQNGDWNANHYNVNLGPVYGQTISLKSGAGFQTLVLNTNFNFLTTAPIEGPLSWRILLRASRFSVRRHRIRTTSVSSPWRRIPRATSPT
jgi:hypothetical protein